MNPIISSVSHIPGNVIINYVDPLNELCSVTFDNVSNECLALIKQVINLDRQGRTIRLYCP